MARIRRHRRSISNRSTSPAEGQVQESQRLRMTDIIEACLTEYVEATPMQMLDYAMRVVARLPEEHQWTFPLFSIYFACRKLYSEGKIRPTERHLQVVDPHTRFEHRCGTWEKAPATASVRSDVREQFYGREIEKATRLRASALKRIARARAALREIECERIIRDRRRPRRDALPLVPGEVAQAAVATVSV